MTALTDRQIATLRALLAGRTVTPDRVGLVEAWATAGADWAFWRGRDLSRPNTRAIVGHRCRLVTALAAMRDDLPAWAETARRLNEKEATK